MVNLPPGVQVMLLTSAEAAVVLAFCPADAAPDTLQGAVRTLHRRVRQGELRPVIGPNQSYLFAVAELERFILASTKTFTSTPATGDGGGARYCPFLQDQPSRDGNGQDFGPSTRPPRARGGCSNGREPMRGTSSPACWPKVLRDVMLTEVKFSYDGSNVIVRWTRPKLPTSR